MEVRECDATAQGTLGDESSHLDKGRPHQDVGVVDDVIAQFEAALGLEHGLVDVEVPLINHVPMNQRVETLGLRNPAGPASLPPHPPSRVVQGRQGDPAVVLTWVQAGPGQVRAGQVEVSQAFQGGTPVGPG